jgi:hypothetical protein
LPCGLRGGTAPRQFVLAEHVVQDLDRHFFAVSSSSAGPVDDGAATIDRSVVHLVVAGRVREQQSQSRIRDAGSLLLLAPCVSLGRTGVPVCPVRR